MAGDWIKMRADLLTHPKVVRMSSALKADRFRIVGGLMSVWCLFDAHSEDGRLVGYTPETLDSMAAWDGFAAAMIGVAWLHSDGENLVLPRFDTHNGQSAKRRAQDADRKQAVRKVSASEADKKRTREEKRREEEDQKKSGADAPGDDPKKAFWDAAIACVGEKNRARIGKMCKQYGEEAVASAVSKAAMKRPADPCAYIAQILDASTGNPWDGAL